MYTFQARLRLRGPPPVSSCRGHWKAPRAFFAAALAVVAAVAQPAAADPLAVKVGVIQETHSRETISILDVPPVDDFVAGARMGMDDNNTTGRFLDQTFSIVDAKLAPGDDPVGPLNTMLADGVRLFIVDLPAAGILAVADAARPSGALVFNAGAPDDRLREEDCRANVIHVVLLDQCSPTASRSI